MLVVIGTDCIGSKLELEKECKILTNKFSNMIKKKLYSSIYIISNEYND
jgi:hypothetical protein